jgi:hypothetical protein
MSDTKTFDGWKSVDLAQKFKMLDLPFVESPEDIVNAMNEIPKRLGVWDGEGLPLYNDVYYTVNRETLQAMRYAASYCLDHCNLWINERKYGYITKAKCHKKRLCEILLIKYSSLL